MGSVVTKVLLAGALTAAVVLLGKVALGAYYDAAFAAGVASANQRAIVESEKKRVEDQKKIDDIRMRAEAEIASRTATNVKKAIDDARKADPSCSVHVPSVVLDALRKGGPR